MTDPANPSSSTQKPAFLARIHQPVKQYLPRWLDVPAHLRHMAYRMANPPVERPQSRQEFHHLLQCLQIPDEQAEVQEKFGYGIKPSPNGDRLIVVWEAHTEYYSYQIWHIPQDKTTPLDFGLITFPDYAFPFCPLGILVTALDVLILPTAQISTEELQRCLPGAHTYASRVFGEGVTIATSFTQDENQRERYLIFSDTADSLRRHISKTVDSIVAIETYYHLILLPFQAFSRAVDQIHDYEQRHLYQRAVIIEQLAASTAQTLQKWLNVLTQDFLQVSRLAESMRYRLAAPIPYDSIVRGSLKVLQEESYPPLRPLSEYIYWKITGVIDGYQQLLRRIDAMEKDFEATIAVIRTQIELRLQEQNLSLQDQNIKLLISVESTTRAQAILQRTVESLSVIVLTYYLAGLASFIFKALEDAGWVAHASYATAFSVPIAFALSFTLMTLGRKIMLKRAASRP